MPHLTIDCSRGFADRTDMDGFCRTLHKAIVETCVFPLAGVRIRVHVADHAIVADDHPDNTYAALMLSVGAGRSTAVLKQAGDRIFTAAQAFLAEALSRPHLALSFEIRVIDADLSWKDTPIHNRLTAAKQES